MLKVDWEREANQSREAGKAAMREQSLPAAGYNIMTNDSLAIGITTATLMVYCTLATLGVFYMLIALLFVGLHVLMIWMVLSILKSPVSINLKWEDQFYQDRPDIRRAGR